MTLATHTPFVPQGLRPVPRRSNHDAERRATNLASCADNQVAGELRRVAAELK